MTFLHSSPFFFHEPVQLYPTIHLSLQSANLHQNQIKIASYRRRARSKQPPRPPPHPYFLCCFAQRILDIRLQLPTSIIRHIAQDETCRPRPPLARVSHDRNHCSSMFSASAISSNTTTTGSFNLKARLMIAGIVCRERQSG